MNITALKNLTPEWVAKMEKLKPWNTLADYAQVSAEATTQWDLIIASLQAALAYKRELETTANESP